MVSGSTGLTGSPNRKTKHPAMTAHSHPPRPHLLLRGVAVLSLAATALPALDAQTQPPPPRPPPTLTLSEVRSLDGTGNDRALPYEAAAGSLFLRLAPPAFADGVSSPAGADRPGARAVSNTVATQRASVPNARGASDLVYQWGQFIDHDITFTPADAGNPSFDVPVPKGDASFDPASTGTAVIPFTRSNQTLSGGQAQQINELSSVIDASMVYGSDPETANALRTLDGTGRLRSSTGNLLPLLVLTQSDGASVTTPFFEAGDIRVNEQIRLIALQTLFLREHNFWATHFGRANPSLTDEQRYQAARAIVAAEIQAVTYREWLPVLLGPTAIPAYAGHRPQVNPTIANEFAAAAFRFGHSMLDSELWRLGADGKSISAGSVLLRNAFFTPWLVNQTGIDPILRGLAAQPAQEIDELIIDDVRNFLFGAPGEGGFDLAALNIQRGRDHGLPSYNQMRRALGLRPAQRFAEVAATAQAADRLAAAYGTVDKLDLWIGGLAERKVPGSMLGETFHRIVRDQFLRLRDGDRFWYQAYLPLEWRAFIDRTRLIDIIRRNTDIRSETQDNVFVVPSATVR